MAAKYAQQAGIPVTGNSADGPEWGEQPYTNMFDAFRGSENPATPVNSIYGNFLKSHGGTVIGTYGYGVSPLSEEEAIGAAESFQRAGGKIGVLDTTVPFGGVDFTAEALIAKKNHVNAILPTMDGDSNFVSRDGTRASGREAQGGSVIDGLRAGRHQFTRMVEPPGGVLLVPWPVPFSLPNAGTEQMAAALTKYAHFTKSEFPSYGQDLSWLGCDLMIEGLQRAGQNPSRASVVKGVTRHQVVQRQRAVAHHHQLLHRLRSRPAPVCLGPASREVRLYAHLVEAILWYGLRWHEHSDRFVEDTKRGSRRRRLEGRSDLQTPPTGV